MPKESGDVAQIHLNYFPEAFGQEYLKKSVCFLRTHFYPETSFGKRECFIQRMQVTAPGEKAIV
ncbi:hypothetical protein AAGQ96_05150 [Pantoea sp. MBD-2R]|uniref:hypothetical protein n=1 Tax=Pantoea sp. MBD-2R TaxID=3141540 RepID=UPI003182C853